MLFSNSLKDSSVRFSHMQHVLIGAFSRFPLLRVSGSVTSFAQLIPILYSMSSRATTPDEPLIPSNTIC